MKRMHVGEEEVSLSQPITAMVPLEEEDVSVPQGLRRLLPEEEDVTVPLEHPLSRSQPPLSQSHRRTKSHRPPLSWPHRRKRRPQSPLSWSHRKEGDACPCTALGKFFALLFLKNAGHSSHPFSS
jgi:hypothetical protein